MRRGHRKRAGAGVDGMRDSSREGRQSRWRQSAGEEKELAHNTQRHTRCQSNASEWRVSTPEQSSLSMRRMLTLRAGLHRHVECGCEAASFRLSSATRTSLSRASRRKSMYTGGAQVRGGRRVSGISAGGCELGSVGQGGGQLALGSARASTLSARSSN